MTGFARIEGALDARRWTWEVKSVNGRGFEMRCRLPGDLNHLEAKLRPLTMKSFSRGSFNVVLFVREESSERRYRVNEEMLDVVLGKMAEINKRTPCEKPKAEGVVAIPGVIETDDSEEDEGSRTAFQTALLSSFEDALNALQKGRIEEGARLAKILIDQIDEIARLTQTARASASVTPQAIRDRLRKQIDELLEGGVVSDDRLAQEAAILAVKADIREELDRLDGHVIAARALLEDGAPVGRRLDFLTQEFNREANTLCSKAADIALKRIGLDLKTVIDQMREQVQNIE